MSVKLLEPMQCVTKEFSAKGAMVSQVIPFLDVLKMKLDWNHSSEPDTTNKFRDILTTNKFRDILTTKDEMMPLPYCRFDQIYSNDTYVLGTLLIQGLK